MKLEPSFLRAARLITVSVAFLLAGCGMKGPLQHPAPPPPADADLATPPTVAPAPSPPAAPAAPRP